MSAERPTLLTILLIGMRRTGMRRTCRMRRTWKPYQYETYFQAVPYFGGPFYEAVTYLMPCFKYAFRHLFQNFESRRTTFSLFLAISSHSVHIGDTPRVFLVG